MDDDDVSFIDLTGDPQLTAYERHLTSLRTYTDSLPYECETPEQMQEILESIVAKLYIAAETKNWQQFVAWDGCLQCWLLMLYPIHKSTRSKLVRLYYELCLLPGVEVRQIRTYADTLARLIGSKYPGLRKLDPADLELPWEPLWLAIEKELYSKVPTTDAGRNIVNILFYVVERCKKYYPPQAVPEMLDIFLPLLTQESLLTIVPTMTTFLPSTNSKLYLPALFKVWEGFNSSIVDDRMLELCAELSEDNVSGIEGEAGDYASEWKVVGIWTEWQWNLLAGKCLSSTNMPMGIAVGGSGNSTSVHADSNLKGGAKIKKGINRINCIAKIFVYSMRVDDEIRDMSTPANALDSNSTARQIGSPGGSRALSTLEKLIDSTESYFHPSNTGPWTQSLTSLIQRLCAEFISRYNDQDMKNCTVPEENRLTSQIRRAFVRILRTPALLAMFSKDPTSASYAQGALRTLAVLEPKLIMPELLERAYGGLEVVNETHRTTGVLSTLAGVARPLVTESIWLGGQKHLVPLLELCIPGIDLNDPTKTIYATMFIANAVQHVKIGDLSASYGGGAFSGDTAEDRMDLDEHVDVYPEDLSVVALSREEERSLTRDSTSSFADWVVSLFRRVFALYENLPEEGGKRNVTGGKSEESVLKSIKGMLDMVCLHLSEPLFDLILKLVFDYATTNAKSNSVRAIGQVISCLAKAEPDKTVAKFLPFCAAQIEEELRHGASNVRTTSSHAAIPSDTTLHWNLSILRGCLGYAGAALLKHKHEILRLTRMLVELTKTERGYMSSGRLITRVLSTLSSVYPLRGRFINEDEWNDPILDRSHSLYWGKLCEPGDVKIDWHVPSAEELDFIVEILETVEKPALDLVESLLSTTSTWDNVSRNDFCRYLHAARAVWIGLPTIIKIRTPPMTNPLIISEFEDPEMVVSTLEFNSCFALEDPSDPRYQKVAAYRERFGQIVLRAASTLRQNNGDGEDHIDAITYVTRSIDTYLTSYGINSSEYETLRKAFRQAREMNRQWMRQKDNSRLIFVRRAHLYHFSRVRMNTMYRHRTELDDQLLLELTELSLSPYTRIRRQAQSTLLSATQRFVRSTRLLLPTVLNALTKGNDPDRMKGALYILLNKPLASYTISDFEFHKPYLLAMLECQHEEKPSIQKLVSQVVHEGLHYINEENISTHAYDLETPDVSKALEDLRSEFSDSFIDQPLLASAVAKSHHRVVKRHELWKDTVSAILEVALRTTTHWRYTNIALQYLTCLLGRDLPVSAEVARFLMMQTTSPQPAIRAQAVKALSRAFYDVKIRTYSKTKDERWSESWSSPYKRTIDVDNPTIIIDKLRSPVTSSSSEFFIDKIPTGFLSWAKTLVVYNLPDNVPNFEWDAASSEALETIRAMVSEPEYFNQLAGLWCQESEKNLSSLDLRADNVFYIKSLIKIFGASILSGILDVVEPLIGDPDKFKQRGGAEMILGILRGFKNWKTSDSDRVWNWITSRFDQFFAQIKPDTISFWEQIFHSQLNGRDLRRNKPMVDWISALPMEFSGYSAFDMAKSLSLHGILLSSSDFTFRDPDKYIDLLFSNTDTDYAELRQHLCNQLYIIMRNLWKPWHPSTEALLSACTETGDPLQIRRAIYMDRITDIIAKLPKMREERLPPPRVTQSEYDKVGLAVLQWIWVSAYGSPAHLVIPYVVPLLPEILRMSELSDSPDLQAYSSGVLYVLSALTPLSDYVQPILDKFVTSIESSTSWRTRIHGLPALAIFLYRNLLNLSQDEVERVLKVLLACLSDENVEVREMASKVLSSVVRTSQRQSIIPLKNRFVSLARKTTLPSRSHPDYAKTIRTLHSAILGLCALIESFPYSVEPWMPPLTEVLAPHATDPPPISTTIRKCASEFKKTHQDTWHKDQYLFDEDQLQSLSSMLVGTSYYA
ncbi:ARM repeat-containing protein [Coprinopsis marcescibilis]|uniref:ARM repeat-containing protein n=1 Tax=Coprinopsis marcescibilis TaxID=230819 RepID=A0A5C3KRN5_COPMA|nr:ARM repeat-containing protein [Coprinopsis marcescibilis]